jgi:uncharacterized membrane protein YdcZ (DUF606 family)
LSLDVLLGVGDELVLGLAARLMAALAIDHVGHLGSSPPAVSILSR